MNKTTKQQLEIIKQLKEEYRLMFELYGVKSGLWSMLHENYSSIAFCPENRKTFIQEYLAWENFVSRAREYDVPYYMGIDEFLKEYKKAVYNCLNLD